MKWTEAEKRVCMEAACAQSWFIPATSAFCVALAHVGVCVSVTSCIECMGCVPEGLFQRDPFLMAAVLLMTGVAPLGASPRLFDHTITSIGFIRCG